MILTGDYTLISSIVTSDEDETRSYKIIGKSHQLDELEQLFHWIESLGKMGHSASASVSCDGDGSSHLTFEGLKTRYSKEIEEGSDPEIKVGLA